MNRSWLLLSLLQLSAVTMAASEFLVYFGTYTGPQSQGIYLSRFDTETGNLSAPMLAAQIGNPSFLAVHPDRRHLYVAGETSSGGSVSAFALNATSGALTPLNRQSSGGKGPCHLSLDATGKSLLVANYGSGSIAAMPVKPDGNLGELVTRIQHTGSSVNAERQNAPHAHFIATSPDNRFALTCDLGLDKILVCRLEPETAKLVSAEPPFAKVSPGSGPRHLVFSPDGKFVYVINEMGGSVTAFSYDTATALMAEVQTISTLPANFTNNNTTAEIAIHPTGKFLYGSNRGHDSVALFNVNPQNGKLTFVERQTAGIRTPRHFAIDPTGHWMLVENQSSDSVLVFALDPATGKLKPTDREISVGSPVCAVFVAVE